MFERFTDRARRVIVLAQEEARMLDYPSIGTEHILLGLIHEGEGVAAKALESLGVSLDAVRAEVEGIAKTLEREGHAPVGHIPLTPRAKKVLELSLREALQLGHNSIGTEHILLGLIREGGGIAARVLVRLDVDLNRVRKQVIEVLTGHQDEEGAASSAESQEPASSGSDDSPEQSTDERQGVTPDSTAGGGGDGDWCHLTEPHHPHEAQVDYGAKGYTVCCDGVIGAEREDRLTSVTVEGPCGEEGSHYGVYAQGDEECPVEGVHPAHDVQMEYADGKGYAWHCSGSGVTPDSPIEEDGVDLVNYPPHYAKGHPEGIECIQVTRYMTFNLGNVVKYLWRQGKKGPVLDDLMKARWYLDDEIARVQGRGHQ